MVALVGLLLVLALTLSSSLNLRTNEAASAVSIFIPHEQVSDALVDAVHAILNDMPVQRVEPVSPDALRAQLAPWSGTLEDPDAWPLPYVVRVHFSVTSAAILEDLTTRIRMLSPRIKVDGAPLWASAYARVSSTVQWLLITLSVLLMGALALLVVFASRTAMRLHLPAVHLLHGIGASDGYIASQFQYQALAMTLKGAIVGTLTTCALLVAAALALQGAETNLRMIHIGWKPVTVLLLLPLISGLLALLVARATTLTQLRRLP